VKSDLLQASETSSHCPWKGDASYYDIVVDGRTNHDAAWCYPAPFEGAAAIESYVAFWRGVEVTGPNPGEPEIQAPARSA
jgi:uncharacterized protein (DUF427 family)